MTDKLVARLQEVLGEGHRIERELTRGGMSRVFLATDLALGRQVVVKVLLPELASESSASRFRREAELAAHLQHPHILPLISAGSRGDLAWLVSPYVSGESLRHRLLRDGRLPIDEALRVLREVGDALAYAHRRGVLHRDVKPENVLLLDEHALLCDFGVARLLDATTSGDRITAAGLAVGTPAYMSPEQFAADAAIDERSDVWALGLLGYEMLAGSRPFAALDPRRELMAMMTQPPPPLSAVRPDVPQHVADTILRALDPDPANRPASAAELRDAASRTTTTSTTAAWAGRSMRRRTAVVAAIVGATALAFVAGAAVVLRKGERQAPDDSGDPRVVAVLPFRVAGADQALAYLREGMLDLAYARLGGDGELRAVAPQTVMGAWRRLSLADGDDLAPETAERLARAVGAGRVLTGSVVGTPERLEFSATLWTPPSTRPAARGSVAGPVDSLTHLVDRLVQQLLAQASGEREQDLGSLTSTSLPALQAYLSAQTAYRQGRYEDAVAAYERALELDSGFAVAALGLYRAAGWLTVRGDQRERALAIGWRHRDRLAARDRAVLESITGLRYPVPPLLADRFSLAQRALERAPDLPELWYALGDLYFHNGRRIGAATPDAQAERYLRGAVERDSTFAGPLMHLVQLYGLAGDAARMRLHVALLLRHDASGDAAEFARWFGAHVRGDDAELRRTRERFPAMGTVPLTWILIGAQQDGVGLDDADAAARELAARRVTPAERQRLLGLLRDHALNRGRPAEALRFGDELAAGGDADGERRRRVFDALLADGDRGAAERAVAQLRAQLDADAATAGAPVSLARRESRCAVAVWHASLGETAVAVRSAARVGAGRAATDVAAAELEAACGVLVEAWSAHATGDSLLPTRLLRLEAVIAITAPVPEAITKGALLLLGRAWSAQGDHARAAAALDRTLYFGPAGPEYWSGVLLERARAAVRAGDEPAAARAFDAYLALRDRPEPAVRPLVDAARAERARVSAAVPVARLAPVAPVPRDPHRDAARGGGPAREARVAESG